MMLVGTDSPGVRSVQDGEQHRGTCIITLHRFIDIDVRVDLVWSSIPTTKRYGGGMLVFRARHKSYGMSGEL